MERLRQEAIEQERQEALERRQRRQRALQRDRGQEAARGAAAAARRQNFRRNIDRGDRNRRREAFARGDRNLIAKTKKELYAQAHKIKKRGRGCLEPISKYDKAQLIQFIQTHG